MLDIFDLVALLDRKSREHARKTLSGYWEDSYGEKLGHFPRDAEKSISVDKTGEADLPDRYAVPKTELQKLLRIPSKGKGAGKRFAEKAVDVVLGSPLVPYDGRTSDTGDAILFSKSFDWKTMLPGLGSSGRLFIWLHRKQAEERRRLTLTIREVCEALGLSKRAVQDQKRDLLERGLIGVEQIDATTFVWTARYHPEE